MARVVPPPGPAVMIPVIVTSSPAMTVGMVTLALPDAGVPAGVDMLHV